MSMEYEYRRISELGRVVTGKTPPTENEGYYDGEFPFITPSDIHSFDEKYLTETERTISSDGAQILQGMLLPPQSICFVCIGSTIGKMCMTNKKSYSSQQINTHIPNKQNDNDYLFYLLRYIKSYFQSIGGGTGSGKGIVNKTLFSKTKLYILIEKADQKRIAKYLSDYDSLSEINNKRIKVLEQMAENLYKEWFVRFRFPGHETVEFENGLPKGWKRNRISQYYFTSSGGTPSRENEDNYENGTIPWIKTGEMQDCLLIDTEEHITEEANKKSSAKLFPKDSVLMAMYGVNIGMLAYSTMDATCNQACCVFKDKSSINTKHYLFQYLKSIREYLLLIGFGAAQQNLSQDLIKQVKILRPDNDTIICFENAIEPIYQETKRLLAQNSNLIE